MASPRPRLASPRPRRASKRLDCRLLKHVTLHQHNRKGQVVMIKTRRYKRLVFGFVFCTWNWYDFWRRSGGLPCSSSSHLVFFWIVLDRLPRQGACRWVTSQFTARPSHALEVPYARWASQCDLRDPGWGDPGFRHCWSAFGSCTSTAILLCCLVVCLCAFCKIQFIFLIHRHISCLSCFRARPSRRGDLGGWFCFVWVFFVFLFLVVGCFICFFVGHPG